MSGGEGIRSREEGSVAKRSGADAGGGPNEERTRAKPEAIPSPAPISSTYKERGKRSSFFCVSASDTVKVMLKSLRNNGYIMLDTLDTNLRESQSGTQILCQNQKSPDTLFANCYLIIIHVL